MRRRIVFGAFLLALGLVLGGCPATPGATCRTHDECHSMTDGYCSRAEVCTRICQDSAACPSNSACVNEGRRRVCLPMCESDDDCVKGFSCRQREEASVCELTQPLDPPQ
jgi:hypothetical protein